VVVQTALEQGNNKIILNTTLKFGLPMENISKVAGPIIEMEVFRDRHKQFTIESRPCLDMADVLSQFKKNDMSITANTYVHSGRFWSGASSHLK
jgi:hypothetical protein